MRKYESLRWVFAWYACCFFLCSVCMAAEPLDLSGRWGFALDPNDVGVTEAWFDKSLSQSITLPGSLQEQGFGEKPSAKTAWTSGIGMQLLKDPRFAEYVQAADFKSPFWLTPDRHYVGVAWYQRQIAVPADWVGQRIALTLERPHWQTSVWVDGQKVGVQDGLGMAHQYDLTAFCKVGEKQNLTIRVDNRLVVPVGMDAHSVSDQTQSNWNGIAGRINLTTTPKVWLDDVQVYPDVANKRIKVVVKIGNITGKPGSGQITAQAEAESVAASHPTQTQTVTTQWTEQGSEVTFVHPMGENCVPWDEYSPALYRLQLHLTGEGLQAEKTVVFGMRELGIRDKQFTINGRKIFLRGTLECCIFPQHGYPPTDIANWKRIIVIAKSYGLNHFRFHSWCPPEAAFVAADELGFYFQVEGSCWAAFGDGTALDTWIYDEIARMTKAYGNHPSFCFFSPSNEPSGRNRDAFLGKLLATLKSTDARRFYVAGAGWPQIAENQYSIESTVRINNWNKPKLDQPPQTAADYRSHVEARPVPVLGHEIGQWCAYPDVSEESQYTGVLKAKNMAIFRDKLEKAGMGNQAHDFLMASGKLQTLFYKAEIEAALRTPGFGGFALLDLHDFPGQGTAPVGVLNALWRKKGYVTPEQYRRFCNDVVPLARMKKLIFTSDETFEAEVEVANYGSRTLTESEVVWTLREVHGRPLAGGGFGGGIVAPERPTESRQTRPTAFGGKPLPSEGLTHVGQIKVPLTAVHAPAKLSLEVQLKGTDYANDWDLWVYPARLDQKEPQNVVVTQDPNVALGQLRNGKRVLLLLDGQQVAGQTSGSFRPIFWNRITFPRNTVHTLGILCDPNHPAFGNFPTDFHSNWQWQDLLDHCKPMIVGSLPKELTPLVQPIDDWNDARKLAVLFEAKLGAGRLIVCSMDIWSDLATRPVARQLRASLLSYMASDRFNPAISITPDQLRGLLR